MTSTNNNIRRLPAENERFAESFLRWQCRLRQICIRSEEGRPNDAMMPTVISEDGTELGSIITVLSKRPEYSTTMEFRHFARRTNDPAQRRKDALQFLAETYYQSWHEFYPELTATFVPDSEGAKALVTLRRCTLRFEQFSQSFSIVVKPRLLSENNPQREATFWHNYLFNPALSADCLILGFEPDWSTSTATPPIS